MKLKSLVAVAALGAVSLAQATTTVNAGTYSVTYDETTPGFGSISSWFSTATTVGFEWSLSSSVALVNKGGSPAPVSFAIPTFTITANPGYVLTGPLVGSLGNITFTDLAGSSSAAAQATVSVDGGPGVALGLTPLTKTFTSGNDAGYFSVAASTPLAGVTSFQVYNASLVLSVTAGSFTSIVGQPQNKLKLEFTAAPVPEPETYALMLAGLGLVGWLARRRARGH